MRVYGIFILTLLFSQNAWAQPLKEMVSHLKPLTLDYGANNLDIGGNAVLIVRGAFVSEGAWGGDLYTVLIHDEGKRWQLARPDEGLANAVNIWSVPHTGEDTITSVWFMVPRDKNTALYLLKAHRSYKHSPLDVVRAEFTLYTLRRDDDFGIYYLTKIASEKSKAKYCNADSAAYHELGIPLPGDGEEYRCP